MAALRSAIASKNSFSVTLAIYPLEPVRGLEPRTMVYKTTALPVKLCRPFSFLPITLRSILKTPLSYLLQLFIIITINLLQLAERLTHTFSLLYGAGRWNRTTVTGSSNRCSTPELYRPTLRQNCPEALLSNPNMPP